MLIYLFLQINNRNIILNGIDYYDLGSKNCI